MSYILDALKKAESERKLGSIPNVYAPAQHVTTMPDAQGRRKWLPWMFTATALTALLACLVWLQPWVQPVRSTSATSNPASAPIATSATPVVAPIIAPTPITQPTAMPDKPMRAAAAETPKKHKPIIAPPAATTIETKVPSKEQVAAESVPDEESIGTIRNLPRAIQAEVPAIVVNGYIYAKNPLDRSVLINQKLLHEGDQIAPELVLEKMLPKGAILNYKGYRYRVSF
jgi:general secretion pathway protein B